MRLEEIKYTINTEEKSWPIIENIRKEYDPTLKGVSIKNREEAIRKGIDVVHGLLEKIESMDPDLSKLCPAHGRGHWLADYSNSLLLFNELDLNPKHSFVSFVGGSLHDIGCLLIKRYEDSKRAVRHAEAGAILLNTLLPEFVNDEERIAISYAVAGHTNYKKSETVVCRDGISRKTSPYLETIKGNPIWSNWFTKAVDRLDCNGPRFVGRWYLGVDEAKEMQMNDRVFSINYNNHMRILIRPSNKQINKNRQHDKTGIEILNRFVETQNNDSPYAQYDYGKMSELRDSYTSMNKEIINAITQNYHNAQKINEETTRKNWTRFLCTHVEPSIKGMKTAKRLDEKFENLDEKTRIAWCHGHKRTIELYKDWAENMLQGLKKVEQKYGEKIYEFPMLTKDIRKIINWK